MTSPERHSTSVTGGCAASRLRSMRRGLGWMIEAGGLAILATHGWHMV